MVLAFSIMDKGSQMMDAAHPGIQLSESEGEKCCDVGGQRLLWSCAQPHALAFPRDGGD